MGFALPPAHAVRRGLWSAPLRGHADGFLQGHTGRRPERSRHRRRNQPGRLQHRPGDQSTALCQAPQDDGGAVGLRCLLAPSLRDRRRAPHRPRGEPERPQSRRLAGQHRDAAQDLPGQALLPFRVRLLHAVQRPVWHLRQPDHAGQLPDAGIPVRRPFPADQGAASGSRTTTRRTRSGVPGRGSSPTAAPTSAHGSPLLAATSSRSRRPSRSATTCACRAGSRRRPWAR